MDKKLNILILEDVPTDAELAERELRKANIAFSTKRVETKETFIKELKDFSPDLILSDYSLPSFDGISALAIVKEKCPDVPFIFISGTLGEELAIETLKMGATDYVLKGRLSRLVPSVHRALNEAKERTERKRAEEAVRALYEDLNKKNRNLEILNTITQAVHRSLNLEEIYNIALDMVINIENVDMAMVYLVDKDRKEVTLQAYRNTPEDYIRRAGRIPYPKGITWKVINTGEIMNVENAQTDPTIGPAGRELGHHAILGIPIKLEEKVIGVIWLFSYEEHRFSKQEVDLLCSIGNQIAIAIAKAKLYRDLSKKNRYETITSTVTQSVHQSINLEDVLENAVETMSKNLYGADNVSIYLVKGEEAVLKANRGYPAWFIKRVRKIPYPKGFTWKTIIEGKPRYCPDVDQDTFIGSAGREIGTKSYLSMPIRHAGKTVGAININSLKKNAFDEEELKLMEIIAQQIETAINNAQQVEAVRQSEERYRRLFETAKDGILILDANTGEITDTNPFLEHMLGYSHAELLGRTLWEIGPFRDIAASQAAFQELQSKEYISYEDLPLEAKSGQLRHVEFVSNVYSVNDRKVIQCNVRDITNRKRAEEALRESEERHRTLIEHTYDLIIETSINGQYLYVSPKHKEVLGYEPSELMDRNIFEHIHPDDRPVVMGEFQRAIKTLSSGHVVYRYRHKDGQWLWLESTGKPYQTATGEVRGVITSRDVTERKRAEEKIREQAALIDIATDAILVRDMEHNILFWNKGAERLYGWKAEEAIDKNAINLLYKEDSPQLIEARKSVMEKRGWTGELHQVTKDGREVIVQSRWTLVYNEEGKPSSILVINTDITGKKKLEAQFLRTQRMESIGTLAGGIAHDLNNVLSPIMMALQLLRQKFTDEQSQNWLNILETSAQRGANLVKQILSFASGLADEHTSLQVRYIISEIEKIAKETFPRLIKIQTDIPKDLWLISGDTTQLHQVLMNLCVNARDAMPNGGTLSISTENLFIDENYARMNIDARVGPYVVITVFDTGIGIPPEIMDRIFEPFFTTKEIGKGTGLGLSTAFGIVKSYGGFIHVYSEVGKGTKFKIYLPAIETTELQKARERQFEELPAGHGEPILVVDDEASIRDITRVTLETYGYRVITAGDGAEALELYTQNREEIRVILVDTMMPVIDGLATLQEIRKINPRVKIITASGLVEKDKLVEVTGTDIHAFLSKPYTAETLLRTLHEALSMK